MMKPRLLPLAFFTAFAGTLAAQSSVTRHKLELDSAGVFPVAGYKSDEYLAAPALRAGYELRLQRYIAVDLGWTPLGFPELRAAASDAPIRASRTGF